MIPANNYFRIMLGANSVHAKDCHQGEFIGGDWDMDFDLTDHLPENYRKFNRKFIPVYLESHPNKGKVAAGLACGMLHTICKGIKIGDTIISPNGSS